MKKPILILQFRTDKSIDHEISCIKKALKLKSNDLKIINILGKNPKFPRPEDLKKYSAVITAASGQFNITDWPDEIKQKINLLIPFFREIIRKEIPTLAICFGNQLIAHLFGGEVATDESQSEVGTFEISLTKLGKKNELFKNIPNKFYLVVGHKDSVTKLPKNAKLLASSARCKNQAYQLGKNFYGIQFHPELVLDALMWRLALYPEYLNGKPIEEIRKEYQETPYATKILENFKSLI